MSSHGEEDPVTTDQGSYTSFKTWFNRVLDNVSLVIKGKHDEIAVALVCLFAEGHLLLEDVPGTGKTMLAKSIAHSIKGQFNRIQFTPDLLPTDVTGSIVPRMKGNTGGFELVFQDGPVFANVLLADEINRASPKTQSALLEAMEERTVTFEGRPKPLPDPFVVIATQNPVEQEGTYRLPEAQLDRFLVRTKLGYPDHNDEVEVLRTHGEGSRPESLSPVMTTEGVRQMIEVGSSVHVEDAIRSYIVRLVDFTRTMPELRLGVSTRGALGLMRSARVVAASQGRSFVTPDDVNVVAEPVLGHRMLLTPEAELAGIETKHLVARVLEGVDLPSDVRGSA